MILYKYASFDDGMKILEGGTIRFTQPKFFNDPFDSPFYPREQIADPVEGIFEQLHTMAKESTWQENTGILSLTRTPTNPLMWAHYADKHRGMVIGIDAIIAGLTDERTNLIPAQYGSVVYVSGRQDGPFIGKPQTALGVGSTYHFPHDHYEKLQRLFLHKPIYWSYEEEVRVVKCLNGIANDAPDTPSGRFKIVTDNGHEIHLYLLPSSSIVEVYFGFKVDPFAADAAFYDARKCWPKVGVYQCDLNNSKLSLGFNEYVTLADSK